MYHFWCGPLWFATDTTPDKSWRTKAYRTKSGFPLGMVRVGGRLFAVGWAPQWSIGAAKDLKRKF